MKLYLLIVLSSNNLSPKTKLVCTLSATQLTKTKSQSKKKKQPKLSSCSRNNYALHKIGDLSEQMHKLWN